jgi:hypothetical protein
MKCGVKPKDPSKTALGVCADLFERFPEKFNGYNILAGKALYLAVINYSSPRWLRRRRLDCGIKRKTKGVEK